MEECNDLSQSDKPKKISARTNSRLYTIQALYQMLNRGQPAEQVLASFVKHPDVRLSDEISTNVLQIDMFQWLFTKTVEHMGDIDHAIEKHLMSEWSMDRLDTVLLCILRAGVCEIMYSDLSIAIIIDEYVDITKSFASFDGKRLVHGILHNVAVSVRQQSVASNP